MDVPEAIAGRRVFSTGERAYSWADVVRGAEERGEVAVLGREVTAGEEALGRVELDPAEVDAAGGDFRRALGLLAAEEMEAWLESWSLSAADWMGFVRRRLALERLGETPPSGDEPAPESLWPEAVCSGALSSWAWELAARAAAGGSAAYDELLRRADTPEARAKALEARQVDWLRVECELLELGAEAAAREAALCVREDGMALEEVAGQAGARVAETAFLLQDAPAGLADPLLSATPGDLVGPIPAGNAFVLALVRAKRPAALDDPEISGLLDVEVPRRAVDSEVKRQIRWHENV